MSNDSELYSAEAKTASGDRAVVTETGAGNIVYGITSYPDYKPVDLPWLDEIPTDWSLPKLRFVTKINPPKSELDSSLEDGDPVSFVPMEAVGEGGGLELCQERPLSSVQDQYTYFEDGDVLIAKITPCFENGKGALAADLTSGVGFGTTELHVLRAQPRVDGRFLFYLTQSQQFREIGEHAMYGAGGQKRVSTEFVEQFRHPVPPLEHQQAIVRVLNRETLRVNNLIDQKWRLIELLEEKHTAFITRAVIKGLDPDVPMIESEVEWFGEIPEHWKMSRLRHVVQRVTSGSRGWADYYADQGALFIRIGNLTKSQIALDLSEKQLVAPPSGSEAERSRVDPGDVLLSITADIGSIAVAGKDIGEAYVNQHVALVRPETDLVAPGWLGYFCLSGAGRAELELPVYGGTKAGLSLGDVKDVRVLIPPRAEQLAIVAYLERRSHQLAQVVKKVKREISLLQEYRTALISSAVTGKIDVRDEAA